MGSRKTGRPSSDPKRLELKVRISEDDKQKIDTIQDKTTMSKSDIVRKGIDKVYQDIKE